MEKTNSMTKLEEAIPVIGLGFVLGLMIFAHNKNYVDKIALDSAVKISVVLPVVHKITDRCEKPPCYPAAQGTGTRLGNGYVLTAGHLFPKHQGTPYVLRLGD